MALLGYSMSFEEMVTYLSQSLMSRVLYIRSSNGRHSQLVLGSQLSFSINHGNAGVICLPTVITTATFRLNNKDGILGLSPDFFPPFICHVTIPCDG